MSHESLKEVLTVFERIFIAFTYQMNLMLAIGPLQLGGHVPSNAELESKLFCDDKSNECLEHHAYVYLKGGYFEFKR